MDMTVDTVVRLIALVNSELEGEIVSRLRENAEIFKDSKDAELMVKIADELETYF